MPFNKTPPKTPAKIGRLTIHAARLPQADGSTTLNATVDFDVLDADGVSVGTQTYDLLENLTSAQKTALTGLLNALAAKAAQEAV